jgi:peptidoglycan/xylan/chitin deacetylase (PgdA/CDA1 family)
MFHHFRGSGHPDGQGAMSAEQFDAMIRFIGRERLLPARAWMDRALSGKLKDDEFCLTFDDGLRCQYEVAYPVMKSLGLDAFWFVYTSPLQGKVERLEAYRYFRSTRYPVVDDFYRAFDEAVAASEHAGLVAGKLAGFVPSEYLKDFAFYTDADRRFRFVRDKALGPARYDAVMDRMLADAGFSTEGLLAKLWMDDAAIKRLAADGNLVGLHSHTHPTQLCALDEKTQEAEYRACAAHLTKILGAAPDTMSHPCNSYDERTLGLLARMGLRLGFRANMAAVPKRGPLEFPREDHAVLLRAMEAK